MTHMAKTTRNLVHGTSTGYTYYACRCNECRAAKTAVDRDTCPGCGGTKRKAAELCQSCRVGVRGSSSRLKTDAAKGAHGTLSRYSRDGCRCNECRGAKRDYEQERRYDQCACGRRKSKYSTRCRECSLVAAYPPSPHGTRSRYDQGCRCEPCTVEKRRLDTADRVDRAVWQLHEREQDALAELARRHGATA